MTTQIHQSKTIFLWPFYIVSKGRRVSFPRDLNIQPWHRVPPDESLRKQLRVTEFFDEQIVSAIVDEWRAPEFTVKYKNTSKTSAVSWRVKPYITVFNTGICVLRLETVPLDNVGLNDLLNFNEHFRYVALMSWQVEHGNLDKYEYDIFWDPTWLPGPQKTTVGDSGALLQAIITSRLPEGLAYEPCLKGFKKLICCTGLLADGLSKEDRFHIATVDEPGMPTPSKEYLEMDEGAVRYSRWEPKHYFAFTKYSMYWLIDYLEAEQWMKDDAIPVHFTRLYVGIIGQLLVHQCGMLTVLSRELAAETPTDPDYATRIAKLRREILEFTNKCWFNQVSYEVQGQEIYDHWQQALDAESLYAEVQQELRETDEYLCREHERQMSERDREINNRLFRLQRVVYGLGAAGVVLAMAPGAFGVGSYGWMPTVPIVWGAAIGSGLIFAFVFGKSGGKKQNK